MDEATRAAREADKAWKYSRPTPDQGSIRSREGGRGLTAVLGPLFVGMVGGGVMGTAAGAAFGEPLTGAAWGIVLGGGTGFLKGVGDLWKDLTSRGV